MSEFFDPVKAREKQKIVSAKQVNLKEFSSILVVAPYNLEDFVLCTPAIAALKEALPPEGKVTAIVSEEVREVAAGSPCIDRVMVLKTVNIAEKFRTLAAVMSGKFNLLVNFNPDFLTAVTLSILSGAKAKVAYALKEESKIYNALHNLKLQTIDQPQHKIVRYLSLVRFIGANSYDFTPKISISEADLAYARQFLEKNGVKPSDVLVGIHPTIRNEKKRWSISKFAQLANNLMEKYGAKVLVFSHRDEKDRLNEFNVVTKKKTIIVDTHQYMKMAAISRFLCCYVCNEDDLMHVFAPFTSIVAIWGDSDPEENKPAGQNNEVIKSIDGNADTVPVSKVSEAIKKHLQLENTI
jgi:ADP-heptose:LPS heptosyltransferase